MKLSSDTQSTLKNFASINSNLVVQEGNTIRTIAEAKNILAKATVSEQFDTSFGVYDLNEFLDPKTFKSYDELKARMNKVLLLEEKKSVQQTIELDDEIDPPEIKRSEPEMTKTDVDDDVFGGSDDDADDNLSFFEKLANED